MSGFSYDTPEVDKDFIACDWNEGDNHLDNFKNLKLDSYVRGDLEKIAISYARNILDIPNNLDLRLTSGSDVGILITLLYLGSTSFSSFRMRQNDYAQVRAFAEISFEKIDIQPDDSIFENIYSKSVIYLSNPGNPTCKYYSDIELLKIATNNPESIFIFDLAYIEYEKPFDLSIFNDLDNVIFLRTFSKYWGLAGARLGAIAFPLNSKLNKIYKVCNSKHISQQHLRLLEELNEAKQVLIKKRDNEKLQLEEISKIISNKFDLSTSIAGNFVRFDCVDTLNKEKLAEYFKDLQITVRDISHLPSYSKSLRFSFRSAAYEKILL